MTDTDLYALARETAESFNQRVGMELLRVVDPPADFVTVDELRELATHNPGDYMAANAYQAIKGRRPRHGEVVKLGHLLGFLTVARRKDGPATLWRLDAAFAMRAN